MNTHSLPRALGLAAVCIMLIQIVSCKKKLLDLWPHLARSESIVIRSSVSDTLFSASDLEWTTPEGCLDLPGLSTGPRITCVLHNTSRETVSVPVKGLDGNNGCGFGTIYPGLNMRLSVDGRSLRRPSLEVLWVIGRLPAPCSGVQFATLKPGDSLVFPNAVNPLIEFEMNPVEVGVYEVLLEFRNGCWSEDDPTIWLGSVMSNSVTFRVEE